MDFLAKVPVEIEVIAQLEEESQKFCVLGPVLTLHHLPRAQLRVDTDPCKSIFVEDSELQHGLGPMVCGRLPFDGNVSQRQPEQINRRVIRGK